MSVKISELPSASSVGSNDVIPIVQGGTTKKATKGMIAPTIATSINSSSTNDEVAGAKAVYDYAKTLDYTALEDITDNYQIQLDTGNLTNPSWLIKKIWKYGDFMLIDFRVSFASRTSLYNNTPMAKIYGMAGGLQGNWFGSGRVMGDNYQRPASFIFFWDADHYAVWGYNNGAEAITGAQASIIVPYIPPANTTRSLNLTKSSTEETKGQEELTETKEQPVEKEEIKETEQPLDEVTDKDVGEIEVEKTTLQNEGSGDSK